MDRRKCCDTCKYYKWYIDKCTRFDCEVDARSVCSEYKNEKEKGKTMEKLIIGGIGNE